MFDIALLTLIFIGLALIFQTMAIRSLNRAIANLMNVIDAQDRRILALEDEQET